MYAFTVTTKDKCRHCIVEFDSAFLDYLKSKNVSLVNLFYKLEESKFTKWHAHGEIEQKWEVSKDDKFFVYFREITHAEKWRGYCMKSVLDRGVIVFLEEEQELPCDKPHLGPREELRCLGEEAHFCYHLKKD